MATKKPTKGKKPEEMGLDDLYPEGEDDADETMDEGQIRKWILQCRESSHQAKFDRMQTNKLNWDVYHMRHDMSHKLPGQSREVLNPQAMAVESTSAYFQQALIDESDWWGCEAKDSKSEPKLKVRPDVVKDLTNDQIDRARILKHVGLGIKSGLLGALIITKVHGEQRPVPKYIVNRDPNKRKATMKRIDKTSWQLKLDVISQNNYYPDPTGAGLYEVEDMWCDLKDVIALSEGPDAIYDAECVSEIQPLQEEVSGEESLDLRRRTDQNTVSLGFRSRVKLTEYWGDILNEEGEVVHANCVVTLANDKHLIRPPTPNPLWHQESPYNICPILDVPDAVWPKALADAGTRHNIALTELYNLMVDGGMRAVNGVSMVRAEWLEDPSELENGIKPGAALKVNSQCPPGAKAIEMVQTGTVPPDAQNMYNIQRQEFNASMLTSDIRSGIQPKREVSATQTVETSQTITSVFKGICEQIEQNWIKKVLEKSWKTVCQFSDEIDEQDVRSVLGDRADDFLKLTPQERFAETVQGVKFSVYGISQQLAKAQDFRKITTLLQTIGASEPLLESFVKRFSLDELLVEAMKSLGINTRRLEISDAEQQMMKQQQDAQQPSPQGTTPDQMSQTQSPNTGSLQDQLGSAAGPQIPQAAFPGSKATPKGGF
jgi:hypothetical protein